MTSPKPPPAVPTKSRRDRAPGLTEAEREEIERALAKEHAELGPTIFPWRVEVMVHPETRITVPLSPRLRRVVAEMMRQATPGPRPRGRKPGRAGP